jgi:hypothetical protein
VLTGQLLGLVKEIRHRQSSPAIAKQVSLHRTPG